MGMDNRHSLDMHQGMPDFSQKTGPWADLPYRQHTISTDGCAVISFAMAASWLLGRTIEPPELIDWIGNRFLGISGRGTKPSFFYAASKRYGLNCAGTNDIERVRQAVLEGKPVIYYTARSKGLFSVVPHYLVLSGINEQGNFLIHNPNDRNSSSSFSGETVHRYRAGFPARASYFILSRGEDRR